MAARPPVKTGAASPVNNRNLTRNPEETMSPRNVLFVCRNNAVSSLMAEAYLRQIGRPLAFGHSAGISPAHEADPQALGILGEVGLKTGSLVPKALRSFALAGSPRMDQIVVLGRLAEIGPLPLLPGAPDVAEWRVTECAETGGRRDAYLEHFAEIRTLVDALLFDLPGVAPVRIPEVA
jgi:protein-tyrosine-phosphatase